MKWVRRKILDVSLRKKIPIIFVIMLLLLICIPSSILYQHYYGTFSASIKKTMETAVGNNVSELKNLVNTLSTTINMVNNNETAYITKNEQSLSGIAGLIVTYEPDEKQENLYETIQELQMNTSTFNSLFSIALNATGREMTKMLIVSEQYPISRYLFPWMKFEWSTLCSSEGTDDLDWYQKAIEAGGDIYWFSQEEYPGRLFLAKLLTYRDFSNHNVHEIRQLGVVVIGFEMSWIEERINISEMTNKTQIFVTDEGGKILFSNRNDSEEIPREKIADFFAKSETGIVDYQKYNDLQYLVQKDDLGQGLQMLTVIPVYDIDQMAFQLVKVIVIVMLAILILGIFLINALSQFVLRPILKLAAQMEKGIVELVDDEYLGQDEIGRLYRGYNRMQTSIQELLRETWEHAQRQKEAEVRALQAQINPHFVFNTLGSMSCFALLNGQDEIAKQLANLSAITRYNTRNPDALVPLLSEIAMIRQYEEIQKMSYEDSFCFHYSVMTECENVMIPKLMIQPLVENAILHGLDVAEGKGEVYISAEIQETAFLVVKVIDSGRGVDTEKINRYIREECNLDTNRESFGVRNVYKRIKLFFGADGDLRYGNDCDGHTEAVITIRLKVEAGEGIKTVTA